MTLSWDADDERVVIEVFPRHRGDATSTTPSTPLSDDDRGARARRAAAWSGCPPALARAFVKRAQAVVAAGRPPCPFCGSPLDPDGHLCPRANGFRR